MREKRLKSAGLVAHKFVVGIEPTSIMQACTEPLVQFRSVSGKLGDAVLHEFDC